MSVGPSDRTFGLQPSEFWAMSIQEWWWMFDAAIDHGSRLKDPNGVSKSEWAEAHRLHKEKMNDRAKRT